MLQIFPVEIGRYKNNSIKIEWKQLIIFEVYIYPLSILLQKNSFEACNLIIKLCLVLSCCAAVFNYSPSVHNVVAVSAAGYKGCTTPGGSKVFKSGKDRITLRRGTNYFICSFAGHCQAGMKIAVTAAWQCYYCPPR